MAPRQLRFSSRYGSAALAFAAAALQACTVQPPAGGRERFPVVLDENRPLYILRADADRYTCGGSMPMICDGATMTYVLCRCPGVLR